MTGDCEFCGSWPRGKDLWACCTFRYVRPKRGRASTQYKDGELVRSIYCYERQIARLKATLDALQRSYEVLRTTNSALRTLLPEHHKSS